MTFAKTKKVSTMLVTQNIDNYHCDVSPAYSESRSQSQGTPIYAFTPDIYEIHGNVLYMRCSNSDCAIAPNFYKCPTSQP